MHGRGGRKIFIVIIVIVIKSSFDFEVRGFRCDV